MLGLMQDRPLLISGLIEYAARYHPDVEIVSRTLFGNAGNASEIADEAPDLRGAAE